MIVSELIDWLKTIPQDAKVEVIHHTNSGCGYYEQGGTATTVDFTTELMYDFECTDGSVYGKTFEVSKHNGQTILTLGLLND